ncbi:hypothetical protein GA0116948_12215 [Chitinophaga costaii]|uniref:6-phosphogluconate dehydrogenase n=1 Tax=Chitinophaga costaii TaxID=1335309 RepID=A0A1C4G495_9BACT|nr:hypothetical protein [Chitinophaga costaii]PUZ22046.1 hypothetical protein DCM91_15065 [Chitinophaga costaii]SCC63029.1 hypothetical protein GA0116948_12215 [Chitinophaga costaii]
MRKFIFILVAIVVVALCAFLGYHYFYVFGDGVKAGELNFFVKKGYVFKTYEGRLIQTGYRSSQPGAIQSNEFNFSVKNEHVAEQLMRASGKQVELHYNEYLGPLPWRGMSEFVVDSVYSISPDPNNIQLLPAR